MVLEIFNASLTSSLICPATTITGPTPASQAFSAVILTRDLLVIHVEKLVSLESPAEASGENYYTVE
ncbi:MAG: hypothetical protein GXO43_09095 [Crenarchaeota archaeon]|nr:hypothetical protein [Thermoproteota archaeon]